jgi:tRNA (guanine-N7-)-methyltransferase
MLEVLAREPLLANTSAAASGYVPRPPWRPLTKFEQRGLALVHGVWDLVFVRRPLASDAGVKPPS